MPSVPVASVTRAEQLSSWARQYGAVALVLLASAWWLLEVTRSWAGRDAPAVTVGAALIAVAVVAVRPDRVLPWGAVVLAAVLSAAAFVVPLTAPTGWAGAPVAATYVCATWLAVAVTAALVSRPETRTWFALVVLISAPVEFASGWLDWWGGRDPSRPMLGTFFWHNPYAAFLIPGGLVGLGFWVWRRRVLALLGMCGFVLAAIGIVYSTSRASLATYVLGFAAVTILAVVAPGRTQAGLRLLSAAVIGAAAAYAIGGPPFFPHRGSPLAGAQARGVHESLAQNGGYRLDFWREALTVFKRHPVTGGGYKSMVAESAGHVPHSWPLSPYAHNGYLQALAEGGLVLALPFVVALLVVAFFAVRSLVECVRHRRAGISDCIIPIALGCVLLHAGVDFDWAYPADLAMTAVLAGLVTARGLAGRRPVGAASRSRGIRLPLAACLVAAAGLLALSGWEMRDGDHRENLPTGGHAVSQAAPDSGR